MAGSRQRLADRLLLVTNLVVANAAAAGYVVLFAQPAILMRGTAGFGEVLGAGRVALLPLGEPLAWLLLVGGVVLLLWNFTWLIRRRESVPPSNWVVSDTASGPVRIAREAIEAGLRSAGEALPEITRVRVQVDTSMQKRVLVLGQFQCAEGTNNLNASQRLRQAMVDRFADMVRPADGLRVEFEFEFQGFAGKLAKKAADLPPPAEADDVPFTGPRYPIDDDHGGSA